MDIAGNHGPERYERPARSALLMRGLKLDLISSSTTSLVFPRGLPRL